MAPAAPISTGTGTIWQQPHEPASIHQTAQSQSYLDGLLAAHHAKHTTKEKLEDGLKAA